MLYAKYKHVYSILCFVIVLWWMFWYNIFAETVGVEVYERNNMNKVLDFLRKSKFKGIPLWMYILLGVAAICIFLFRGNFNRLFINNGNYHEDNHLEIKYFNFNNNSPRKELFEKKMLGLDLPKMIDVVWAQSFVDVTDKAVEARERRDYERVQSFARKSRMQGEALMDDARMLDMPLSDKLKESLSQSANVFSDSMLSIGEYHEITSYYHMVKEFGAINPTNEAIFDYAKSRLGGNGFVLPSMDDIKEKRKKGEDFSRSYLNVLASYGFLQPFSITLGSRNIEYTDYAREYGVNEPLKYRDVYQVKTHDDKGEEMISNRISSRYCGLGRSESYDLTDAISGIRMKPEKNVPVKIWFNKGSKFDDRDVSNLLDEVCCHVTLEGAEKFSFDQEQSRDVYVYTAPLGRDAELARMTAKTVAVPEPSSVILLIMGVAGLALRRKQRGCV